MFACAILSSCADNQGGSNSGNPEMTASATTQRMAEELRAIAENPENTEMWFLNDEKAAKLEAELPHLSDNPGRWIGTVAQAAIQWLNAGDYERSIELMDSLFANIEANKAHLEPEALNKLKEIQAIAFLRKGEIENCLQNHNAFSCLLPIQKSGQHELRTGSESASVLYKSMLESVPDDMQSRWLYNVAQMTLGNYPGNLPPSLLIDPRVFESEAELPRFTDVAGELGVAVNAISGSVVLDDFNGDHYLDLMVSSYGLKDQLRYFESDGNGGYADKTADAGLTGLWSGLNMIQADYDNDGLTDVLVLRGAWLGNEGMHPNSLLKNEGGGHFRDVTREAGLYSLFPTQTASWGDYNNDGWIDLFVGNETTDSLESPCQMYVNNGDGTFTDKATDLGLDIRGFVKGCSWGDVNRDGWPDLYVSNMIGANYLMMNSGNGGRFTDVSEQAGVQHPLFSFPCWFFDFDQDGWQDIFVSGFNPGDFETAAGEVAKDYLGLPNQAEKPRLYRNRGDGTFDEISRQARIDKALYTMGCNFGDLNNDGYLDFYAATGTPDFRALIPNRMFLNDGGIEFKDVTSAGGFGHLQKGHGVAFGDVDADGDQDVYTVLGGSYAGDRYMNALYLNPGAGNHWISLKLVGSSSNRSAIGAAVRTVIEDSDGNEKVFHQRVSSGGSFGANPLRIEQGLGANVRIDRIEIDWPGENKPQIFTAIAIDHHYVITQDEPTAERLELNSIQFKNPNPGNHEHDHQ